MKNFYVKLLLLISFLLSACSSIDVQHYRQEQPKLELKRYLNGDLRAVRATLPMVLACASRSWTEGWVLPKASAQEARLVPGVRVWQAEHLCDIVGHFRGEPCSGWAALASGGPPPVTQTGPDLAEVRGHGAAKRALCLAAAGGHNLLMVGPPGSGKSMLAQRLPGLLPRASGNEALQIAALQSLAGLDVRSKWGQRPWRAPHHSATAAAMSTTTISTRIRLPRRLMRAPCNTARERRFGRGNGPDDGGRRQRHPGEEGGRGAGWPQPRRRHGLLVRDADCAEGPSALPKAPRLSPRRAPRSTACGSGRAVESRSCS